MPASRGGPFLRGQHAPRLGQDHPREAPPLIHGFKAARKWSIGSKACRPNSTWQAKASNGRPSGIRFTRSLEGQPLRLSTGVRTSPWCSRASKDRAAMTDPSRRFPAPWRADPAPGGYVVRDTNGQALAYSRDTSRSSKWRTGRATAERAPGELRRAVVAPKHRLDSGYRGFLPFAQCEQSCSLDNGRDHRISWLPVVGGASCSRFENPDLSAGFVAPAPHHSVSAEQDEAGWPHQGCQGHRR
jgi:hypothetical protein